jgi:hypothetical protein
MGLDTTHDCWHGAYSAFMRWRTEIAHAAGLPPLDFMDGFWEQGGYRDPLRDYAKEWPELAAVLYRSLPVRWDALKPDPLHILLSHSDCEGSIASADCGPIADSLERLLPALPEGDGGGHIGNWRAKTLTFIAGLRLAASRGEDVEFH